jgi:hypothetical protein
MSSKELNFCFFAQQAILQQQQMASGAQRARGVLGKAQWHRWSVLRGKNCPR